jgi:2-dehydro-3-deoxygalactonokinase
LPGALPRVTGRSARLIAVDWGTTSARAYRLDADGMLLDAREAPLGVQQVREGFAQALASLLGDWIAESVPRIACGMIGSRQGWIEAPYVDCPATTPALVKGLVQSPDGALVIVPGLADCDDEGIPDVMRGEETQIVGAVDPDAALTLAVLPGTHSKWAIVRGGTIETFVTFMTGEVYAALRDHTILGRMANAPAHPFAAAAFANGVHRALAQRGSADSLLHRLFSARTLALRADLAPQDTADYLSGLLIGTEIVAGCAWARGHGVAPSSVLLLGSRALCERYSAALGAAGVDAETGSDDAAARGLWRIAKASGLVG